MMIIRKGLLAIFLSMCSVVAWAAPGDLDISFGGGDGWVSHGFNNTSNSCKVSSVIQQADGKLVSVCTFSMQYGAADFALTRLNSDSSLDTSFDGDGKVIVSTVSNTESPRDLIQQTDGKLVVAGSYNNDFVLMRFNADGSLDAGFDGDGILQLSLSTGSDWAQSVFQLTSGKLLVVGGSGYGGESIAFVRLNTDGSLDTSFDGDGMAFYAAPTVNLVALLQADEKIVVATGSNTWSSLYVLRFDANAMLDTTFDGDGRLDVTGILVQGLVEQSDGKLVIGARSSDFYQTGFIIQRYSSAGVIDATFDGDGMVRITSPAHSSSDLTHIIQQSDGKLVAAGFSRVWHDGIGDFVPDNFSLARFNLDGSLDTTFSGDGLFAPAISSASIGGLTKSSLTSLIQQSDGRLVAAGYASSDGGAIQGIGTLARYNTDGSPDASFDGDGVAFDHFKKSNDYAKQIFQQADGKWLIDAGPLLRYSQDGTLDSSFDGDGVKSVGASPALLQQPDGKLLTAAVSGDDILVQRFHLDGSPDTTFSGDGQVIVNYANDYKDVPISVLLQPDGKIIIIGSTSRIDPMYINPTSILIIRLNVDGSLDTSFSGDGIANIVTQNQYETHGSAALLSDGSIVIPGGGHFNDYQFYLCRIGSDGSGASCRYRSAGINDYIFPIGIISLPDNKFYAEYKYLNATSVVRVRYYSLGDIDTTFGTNGVITIPYPESGLLLPLQEDGKRMIVTSTATGGGNWDYRLKRFNVDGSLDTSFDGDGEVDLADIPDKEVINAVYRLENGDLLVAGSLEDLSDKKILVAKFSMLIDTDNDGIGDEVDTDDDNDGVIDINDAFPQDPAEWLDTDGDGTGDNADADDDNDGIPDIDDDFPLDPTKSRFVRHDTEADGDSDLLTRSASLGTWTRHTIQNAAITGTGSMNAYTSSSVQYVAQLDANGDGDADILTRNTSTGAWYLHQVQNGAVLTTAPIYLYANLDQQFIGAGDFNGDGTDDVMLRSSSGGYYTVFLLSNYGVNSAVFYNAWTASSSVPQGVGDFDGDGTDDLLVRRTSDNLYFIFRTTNGGTTNSYCACNIWNNPDWTFQFAGDTNKDGTDDIVIRGTGASADGFWWNFRMSNFSSTQTTNLNTFLNKTQVSFAASGDYNGDGHTDMLIRVNNGPVYVARIVNGLVSGSTTLLSNLPADQTVLK